MKKTESRFKWMETLNAEDLKNAISKLSLEDTAELVGDVLDSEATEPNLRVAVVAQSQIIANLTQQLIDTY